MTMSNQSQEIARTRADLSRPSSAPVRKHLFPVDVYEGEASVLLVADIPGVRPEDLKVELRNQELHIEARQVRASKEARQLERQFRVGVPLDENGVTAELKQGVLRVTLRKSPELRPRRIAVSAS